MSSWARVGVKCVCVDAGSRNCLGPTRLVEGAVYVITATHHVADGVGLDLDGEDAQSTAGFAIERFRPLVTKTQADDVALFAPLLAGRVGTKQGVDA